VDLLLPAPLLEHGYRGEDWSRWLGALPRLAREVLDRWQLVPEGPGRGGVSALVLPVRTADGQPAALRLGWPHPDQEHLHLALRSWAGDGAVTLLRAEPRRGVLLLERADAERDLGGVDVLAACETVAGLYGRLHRPPLPQLDRLSEQARRWSGELAALERTGVAPRRFVDQAAGLARELAEDPGTDVALLHGDLHYGNVLAGLGERAGEWLAIDAAPLAGDPAFEVAPLLSNRWDEAVASHDLRGALVARLETVVDAAGLDEDRVRGWVVVRSMMEFVWALADDRLDRDEVTRATTIVKAVQR
jgi:streptomycin 6-kinase